MTYKTTKTYKIIAYLLYLFIFLTAIDFVNRFYVFAFCAFFLLLIYKKTTLSIGSGLSEFSLTMLSMSIVVFSPYSTTSILNILKPFVYLLFFVLGYNIISKKINNIGSIEKEFYKLLLVITLGTYTHFILNFYVNLGAIQRNTIDFWSGLPLSATGQAAMACIALSVSLAVLFSDLNIKFKFISVLTLATIILFNLVLAGRSIFVLIFICILTLLFQKGLERNFIKEIMTILFGLLLLYIFFSLNIFGVYDFFESSSFYQRFFGEYAGEITHDSRIDKKIMYLNYFFDHLFGGINFRDKYGYAHDIFLDTYDECGIFALFFLILYLITSTKRCYSIVFNEKFSFLFRQIVLSLYIVIFLQFMLEPILQGFQWLFASFCMIDGAVAYIIKRRRFKIRSR